VQPWIPSRCARHRVHGLPFRSSFAWDVGARIDSSTNQSSGPVGEGRGFPRRLATVYAGLSQSLDAARGIPKPRTIYPCCSANSRMAPTVVVLVLPASPSMAVTPIARR
jgi:hypothetical protein